MPVDNILIDRSNIAHNDDLLKKERSERKKGDEESLFWALILLECLGSYLLVA